MRAGSPWSTGLGLRGDSLAGELQVMGKLGRLTEHKNKNGDISSSLAWDDLTGMRLDAGLVKDARSKEIRYVRERTVYNKIPRSVAVRNGWKIISTRWVDINKGDNVSQNVDRE